MGVSSVQWEIRSLRHEAHEKSLFCGMVGGGPWTARKHSILHVAIIG